MHREDSEGADRTDAPAVAHTLPVGVKIGEVIADKYRVDAVLGQGGMGVVLAARDLSLDRTVALKFTIGQNDEHAVARFLREARIIARLESEYVVKILDTGRLKSGAPYIVMESLEGETLARALARRETLPPELLVDYVLEACDAVAEAHSLGIIHRDLKPSNVFLSRRADGGERVKVLDFGISKTLDHTPLTLSAAFLGSPQYVAPEQIESARVVDQRTDIWALGVILYEGLSGRRPFSGATLSELCMNILAGEAEPLRGAGAPVSPPAGPRPQTRPVPRALAESVERCLAKRPDDRPATVLELARALAPFASARGRGVLPRIERLGSRPSVGPSLERARVPAVAADGAQQTERTWEGASQSRAVRRRPRWWVSAGLGVSVLLILYAVYASTRSRTAPVGQSARSAAPANEPVETAPSAAAPSSGAPESSLNPERAIQEEPSAQSERLEPSGTASAERAKEPPPSSRRAQSRREASGVSISALATAREATTATYAARPTAPKSCVASRVTEGGRVLAPSSQRKVTFEWARGQCSNSNRSGTFSLDRGSVRIRCECEP